MGRQVMDFKYDDIELLDTTKYIDLITINIIATVKR